MEDRIMENFGWYSPITLLGLDAYTSEGLNELPLNSEEMFLTLTDEDLQDWGMAIDARRSSTPSYHEEILDCF
jgi:hypothetical protein